MRTFCDRPRLFLLCLLLFSSFLLAAGCSSDGSISGKVYYKGKVVTRGTVGIYPEGKGGNYASGIESDGSYSISKVPPGPAKISVVIGMKGPPPDMFNKMGRSKEAAKRGMKKQQAFAKAEGTDTENAPEDKEAISIPAKYANPDESGLTVTITGGSQTHDIKIE